MIDVIVERFLAHPKYLDNGAGYLAKAWKVTKGDIYKAKEMARAILHSQEITVLHEVIEAQEDVIARFIGSDSTEDGQTKRFESARNLTPEEVEKLVGVDNINTYVARVWEKMLPSGKWTYSIDVRWRVKDFFTADKLKQKLAEIMPNITPYTLPPVKYNEGGESALCIVLADDHVGAINTSNLFDNKEYKYADRLMEIAAEVVSFGYKYDEIHIISLGDQLNGWNKKTTRGGHEVNSVSNEEQFDEYVKARVQFYDAIFSSGMSENYFIHDVENSNHSGLGMSYMANRALEMYLDAKYPQIIRESITNDVIGGFQYGKHVVLMGHGKDEKFQRRPMPAVLNAATDLYLYDFAQNKGYSPYNDNITFYKGDLHQLGLQHGKFGRYVNVQSLAGNSDYGDLNYGNTRGGALIEIMQKHSSRILSYPVWF